MNGLVQRGTDLDKFRAKHQQWLSDLGLLGVPWLILGSAPSPTLPSDILSNCARVDVNNSGKTAEMLGLGPAALTFRKRKKDWNEHLNVRTRGLLWLHTKPLWLMRLAMLTRPTVKYESLRRATKEERDDVVDSISGGLPAGYGELGKVTNGVAAACYALFVGTPVVILAGFSTLKMGHSYNDRQKRRRQIEEDRYILKVLSTNPRLFTTEPELSAETGIRLCSNYHDLPVAVMPLESAQ